MDKALLEWLDSLGFSAASLEELSPQTACSVFAKVAGAGVSGGDTWSDLLQALAEFYFHQFRFGDSPETVASLFRLQIALTEPLEKPQIRKIVELLLGVAAHSSQRTHLISLISNLTEESQSKITESINQTIQTFAKFEQPIPQYQRYGKTSHETMCELIESVTWQKQRLEEDLRSVTSQRESLTQEKEELQGLLAKLQEDLQAKHQRNNSLENLLQSERERYRTQLVANSHDFINPYQAANENLRNDLVTKEQMLADLSKEVERLWVHSFSTKELRERLEELEAVSKNAKEMEILIKANEYKLMNMDQLKARVQLLEEENKNYLEQKCQLEEVTQTVIPRLEEKVQKYKERIVALSNRDADATLEVTDKDELIVSLQSKIAAKIEENKNLRLKVEILEEGQREQQDRVDVLLHEKVEFEGVNRSEESVLKEKICRLTVQNDNLKSGTFGAAEIEGLQDEIDIQANLVRKKRDENALLSKQLTLAQNERDELSHQLQLVTIEFESKNSQLSQQLRDVLNRHQIETLSSAKQLEAVNEECARLAGRLQESEGHNEEMQKKTNLLSFKLQESTCERERLIKHYKSEQSELLSYFEEFGIVSEEEDLHASLQFCVTKSNDLVREFKATIKEQEKKCSLLQRQIQAAHLENERLQEELDLSKHNCDHLTTKKEETLITLRSVTDEKDELQNKLRIVDRELNCRNSQLEEAKQRLHEFTLEKTAENSHQTQQILQLETNTLQLREQIRSKDALIMEANTLKQAAITKATDIEKQLAQMKTSSREEIDKLTKSMRDLKDEHDKKIRQKEAEAKKQLHETIIKQTESVKGYTEATNVLQSKLEAANAASLLAAKQKRDLDALVADLKNEIETLKQNEQTKQKEQEEKMNQAMAEFAKQEQELNEELNEKLTQVNEKIDQYQAFESTKAELEKKLEQSEQELLLVTQAFYKLNKKTMKAEAYEAESKENSLQRQSTDELANRIRNRNDLTTQAKAPVVKTDRRELERMSVTERRQHTLANRTSLREQALASRGPASSK